MVRRSRRSGTQGVSRELCGIAQDIFSDTLAETECFAHGLIKT